MTGPAGAGLARSARRWRRLADVMLFDGFRAAPAWMCFVTALLIVGGICSTCYPLGYRLLVDGITAGSTGQLVAGVAVVAGLVCVGWLLTSIAATDSMALTDRIAMFRVSRLIQLISGVPGLEHLERPEYLTELDQLNANRRQLAGAPRLVLQTAVSWVRIAALLVLLGSVSPWLLLLPVSAVPPMVADRVVRRISRRAEDAMGTTRRLANLIFGLASEPTTAAEIRAYGLTDHLVAEHERLTAGLNRRTRREAATVLLIQSTAWLLYAATLMGAVAFVVVRASNGSVSLGTVLMTVSLIRRSRVQLVGAANTSGALVAALTTADRLLWLEDHAAAQAAVAGRAPAPARLVEGIRFRGVRFAYPGTDHDVLTDFDVTLPAGATVALVGENGSGKTTLVKLLLGMYRPDAGAILVDGVPLTELDPVEWRARCAAAFQDFARFQLPAVVSVGIADLADLDDADKALAALARAGAADLPGQLPNGLATQLGSPATGGHGLSGGQWQKVALGRAMRRAEPLLVVLDEPTASLDAHAEHALFERYAEAAARSAARTGAITVLVSHRFSTVRVADLIVFLQAGRAVEVGSHDELIEAGGRYAELFGLQAAGYR